MTTLTSRVVRETAATIREAARKRPIIVTPEPLAEGVSRLIARSNTEPYTAVQTG